MEFDWLDDPFAVRLLPDADAEGETRFFCLGRSVSNTPLFSLFWADGKRYRVIFSRPMTPEEEAFYERKNAEFQ